MSETQTLLSKIMALRQRLDQAQGLANEARSAVSVLLGNPDLGALETQAAEGAEQARGLDAIVRPLHPRSEESPGPRRLSSRGRRVLERGKDLLLRVRELADHFTGEGDATPLTPYYRATVELIDTAMRTISLLPDSMAAQLHLCRGLEETLEVVDERVRRLGDYRTRRQREQGMVEGLESLLGSLCAGRPVGEEPFRRLGEGVLAEVAAGEALRFLEGDPNRPAHFAACRGLTVARVVVRVVSHDPVWRDRAADLVLAALLHDAGMARVPAELLAHPGALDVDQRRVIEGHCRLGAELVALVLPDQKWLSDAAEHHHERLDGTGYPDGLREGEALTRLLAVCGTYAALCSPRAHRPARSSRTALADTLLLAEQGGLDPGCAELLLPLSFYPVGSMVELTHGERGVVVATPQADGSIGLPARPVVALLTDPENNPLPRVRHVDMTRSENRIARSLSAEEQQEIARRFPEWAA